MTTFEGKPKGDSKERSHLHKQGCIREWLQQNEL